MTFTERLYTNLGSRIDIAVPAWRQEAACRDADPSLFFPEAGVGFDSLLPKARAFCNPCPVRQQCLEDARSFNGTWGIFGGKAFGSNTSAQRFTEAGETVACEGCGTKLVNQKGGRVRKWCSMNCRYEALKEAS